VKITLCGSLQFIDDMVAIKQRLVSLGHEVEMPPTMVPGRDGVMTPTLVRHELYKQASADDVWLWDQREKAMRDHYQKIAESDAILVVNQEKRGVPGYIGINTMMEMGLALHLRKPIFLFNAIPELSYKEEVLGMKPVVIKQDLRAIQ
jgi:nucleoside 2-deoxyribosyltransferase